MRQGYQLTLPRRRTVLRRLADGKRVRIWEPQPLRLERTIVQQAVVRGFPTERLRAFATRFAPSKQTAAQTAFGLSATAAIYLGIAALAVELATANFAPLFR